MLITDKALMEKYSDPYRLWQGIPGIEVTRNGRTFITFYSGGTREELGNFVLLYAADKGKDYSLVAVVAPEEGYRFFDPCLWIDTLGRLWFIWNRAPEDAALAYICEDPDAEVLTWSQPRFIGDGVMLNKPTVLSTGEWLFPVALWAQGVDTGGLIHPLPRTAGAYVYKSIDCGNTFHIHGFADVPKRHFDEHMVLEMQSGVLKMLVRTYYGIGVSYSYDRGETWTRGVDSNLGGPSSRFCLRRLRSGRVILINHYKFKGRNNLTALLSEDDGKTFPYQLLLDERELVSYPDLTEAEDGYIYITYDRDRGAYHSNIQTALNCAREILVAKITEADILAGRLGPGSELKTVVNKLGAYEGENQNPYDEACRLPDGELAEKLLACGDQAVDEVFNLFPLNCIYSKSVDSEKLDALIEEFDRTGHSDRDLLEKIIHLLRSANMEPTAMPVVDRVMDYVNAHFDTDFMVREVAQQFNCSVYHLCHQFKANTGITIIDYRNKLRLSKAKERLITTNESIADVASYCGYSSESYFGRIFVREEGVSPSAYRKTVRGEGK